ncbi:MAG: hypothetical protein OJF49_002908 [Ktedonobacterales bacterium]|jgi:trehalose 6-phosphate phosphatase|nr:MAG: hypothetical protein OJF49_002908 [Ktedonobacterales bacterium]
MPVHGVFPGVSEAALARIQSALGRRPRGLFSDIDGTISAIAPTPEAATLLPGVRELIEQAREVFDVVALVSGRAATDAFRMAGVRGITYIGNHGLETALIPASAGNTAGGVDDPEVIVRPEAQPYALAVEAALRTIEERLGPRFAGLQVERKGVTGSIHVRNTRDPAAAETAVYALATELAEAHGLRVTRGKMVVELRPPLAVDKGTAIAEMIEQAGLRGAIYLGDDRTDVDAFRALRRLSAAGTCEGVSVAVLHGEAPPELTDEADVALASVVRVPDFLRWLLALARD